MAKTENNSAETIRSPAGRTDFGDARGVSWTESTLQDLRLALRSLRKSPGFALTAILTLALGIGVNAAIFQLIDAVRLRSLPVVDPRALVGVQIKGGNYTVGIRRTPAALSLALFEQIRKQQQGLSSVFAWFNHDFRLGQGAQQRRAPGLWVSGDTFYDSRRGRPSKGAFSPPKTINRVAEPPE